MQARIYRIGGTNSRLKPAKGPSFKLAVCTRTPVNQRGVSQAFTLGLKMAPNRAQRVKVAEETLSIADHGHYTSHQKGNAVDLSEQIKEAVANSKVYSVAALGTLRDGLTISEKSTKSQARIVVTDEHAITCCSRLRESHGEEARIGCLNFASAKNVCGGMKGGSLAQEESLGESGLTSRSLILQLELQ